MGPFVNREYFSIDVAIKQLSSLVFFTCMCLALSGCIFGYVVPAPDGYHGDFVLTRDAQLTDCSLGPGFWSSSKSGTCIVFDCSSDCSSVPMGTPIKVLHTFVNAEGISDVSVRVGSTGQVAHLYGTWEGFKKYLARR